MDNFRRCEGYSGDGHVTINGHDAVDLGLPSGTLWATCNVGSTDEMYDVGNYYQWCAGSSTYQNIDLYHIDLSHGGGYSVLYDPAYVVMGEGWHMPSRELFNELYNNTTKSTSYITTTLGFKTTLIKYTSKINPNAYIYIICGGYYKDGLFHMAEYYLDAGYYWTNNILWWSSPVYATVLYINGAIYTSSYGNENCGYSVRGVYG